MVFAAGVGARNAENDRTNDPGMCQQQTRIWSGISARYPDAATAWRNTNDRHPGNRNPPRGAHVFWTGGSSGHGHVAMSLGGGKVRSTDAGGRGRVATVDLGWVERNWGHHYAGWAWDNNEQTIPHSTPKPPAKDTPNPNLDAAVDHLNKAISANKDDKDLVKVLTKHRDALKKLAKKN